jgi:hypothetical protein
LECVLPDSLAAIEHDLGPLSEEDLYRITCEDAGKLYGLF